MADTSVALLNLLPGVPAVGTLSPGTVAATDGLSFTALLNTEIDQLGTATATTGDDLLDLETTDATTDESTEATIANPLALLLGGVLLPTPFPTVPPTPTETTTGTTTTAPLPAVVPAAVPTRVDASRVESLRFDGPVNPITPTAVEANVDTPDVQPSPTPTATRAPSQPVAPTPPQNTTPTAIEPTSVPPAARVIVPQTPVIPDRSQALPPPPVELRPVPVQSPVGEPERVAGLPPVVADQQPAIQQQRTNVTPQPVPTPTDAPFADVVKQAATPTRPTQATIPQTGGPVLRQIDPEAVPALTADKVIGSVRPTVAFEPERKPLVAADGTQAVDSARVQPHTTPVASNPSVTLNNSVADSRPSLAPAQQIGDTWITHADVRSRGGEHEFHLRLDPPELGEVRVRVHSSADGVRAELTVASDAVRAMIESQIPELRQRLQDGGVSVTQFDVTTNTPGEDSSARNPYRESAPQEARADTAVPAAKLGRTRDPTSPVGGLLDVTA